MNYKLLVFLISFILFFSCVSEKKEIFLPDRYLIVPGKSAEGYNIGDSIPEDSSIAEFTENKKLSDIFNTDILNDLQFNSVVYVRDSHALFLKDNVIAAIAGFKITKRVTSDAVLLSKGVDNFIMNYGNEGLKIISNGLHKIYIYRETGIAVFDDNNDNNIDMYLVFIINRLK